MTKPVILCSGAFDPLHVGHVRYLKGAANLADFLYAELWVAVNDDAYCIEKKGYCVMPLDDRIEMIEEIRGVDRALPWFNKVLDGLIVALRPVIFAKGADKDDPKDIPEWGVCQRLGVTIVTGLGEGREGIHSSTLLLNATRGEA